MVSLKVKMDSKASEKNRSIPNIAIFSLVVSSASIFAVLAIVVWFSQKFSDIKQEQILLRSNAPNLQQTLTPVQNKIDQNEKGIHTLRDKAEKMESRMDALKTELSSAADHLSKLQTKFLEKEQTPTQTDTIEKHQKQID